MRKPEGLNRAPLAAIVLAAGAATRFGSPKQLALLNGVPLVRRVAGLARSACPGPVIVVTGAHGDAVAAASGPGVTTVHNPLWREGLAGSLRAGIDALPAETTACLVVLADQAGLGLADLRRLCEAWSAEPAVPACADPGGHLAVPAIFPAATWPLLRGLAGDRGARDLLASWPRVTRVAMPAAAIDVDTPEDLDRLSG